MDQQRVTDQSESSGRLVIVDGIGAASHRWRDGLIEFRPEVVASLGQVDGLCPSDVVILDLPELGDETLASIRASVAATSAMTLLTASHHELPGILRSGVNDLFRHVIPRSGLAANVKTLVAKLRLPAVSGEVPSQTDNDEPLSWSSVIELLQWTLSCAVHVPGVIIRSYQARSNKFELQLVFPLGRDPPMRQRTMHFTSSTKYLAS